LTTHQEPSANEDEYFVKRDAELLRQQRQVAQRAATRPSGSLTTMRCPKCGYDLLSGDCTASRSTSHPLSRLVAGCGEAEALVKAP